MESCFFFVEMAHSPASSQASERVAMSEQRLPQASVESTQEKEERQATEDEEEDDEDDEDKILEEFGTWQKLNQQVRK